jgi:hypothetical protein
MKMYWGVVADSTILYLGTRRRRVVSPGRFTSSERTLGAHSIGDWVGPRVVLDAV